MNFLTCGDMCRNFFDMWRHGGDVWRRGLAGKTSIGNYGGDDYECWLGWKIVKIFFVLFWEKSEK